MIQSADIRKVKIDPIGCYSRALELVKGRYWLLLGVSAAGTLIGGAVPIVLMGPMMCGVYMCFLAAYRGSDFAFELLFKGFDLLLPSLIASLIITGISLVVIAPGLLGSFAVMLAAIASSAPAVDETTAAPVLISLGVMLFLLLLVVALVLLVGMFFVFTFPLIVDRKLSGTDALVVSAKAAAKNFAGVLGLTLIGVALGLAGGLACYVGTFFILPISFAALTIAYRKVFPEIDAAPEPMPQSAPAPLPHTS